MTKLSKELGISDVGLAKACRRNGIPVPPRGHWAKLAAGKASPQLPLRNPENDSPVALTLVDPVKRSKAQADIALKKVKIAKLQQTVEPIVNKEDDGVVKHHSLVKESLLYVSRIPLLVKRYERLPTHERYGGNVDRPPYADKGRRHLQVPNGLNITVSDDSAEWAILMHDKLIKSLSKFGCKFSMQSRREGEGAALCCELAKEKIYFNFSEGYRKFVFASEVTTAELKRPVGASDWEWRPSGKYTWSARGSEYSIGREWSGKRTDFEAKFSEIVATCLDGLERQSSVREERLAAEAASRREAEDREKKKRAATARREQLDHALEIAQIHEKEQVLKKFLDKLDQQVGDFNEAFQPKLAGWLAVVRDELEKDPPHIRKLADAILQPYWRSSEPDWWPNGMHWPEK